MAPSLAPLPALTLLVLHAVGGYALFRYVACALGPVDQVCAGFLPGETLSLPARWTYLLAVIWYLLVGCSVSAGYHRLYCHRTFVARWPLRVLFAFFGAGAFMRSIRWFAVHHRAHHLRVATDRDPCNIKRGFFYAHLGWWCYDHEALGIDTKDLDEDRVVTLQSFVYPVLSLISGLALPTFIAHRYLNDFYGGLFVCGVLRALLFFHAHSSTNSFSFIFGKKPYDLNTPACDSSPFFLLSLGESYQNFHFNFPHDYRIGTKWGHADITKWAIRILELCGLVTRLQRTPRETIVRSRYQCRQQHLDELRSRLNFGPPENELPLIDMERVKARVAEGEQLIVLDEFVLDVSTFTREHPGGEPIIRSRLGKDATLDFNGQVFRHPKAARNIAMTLRVARIPFVKAGALRKGGSSSLLLSGPPSRTASPAPSASSTATATATAAASSGLLKRQ